MLYTLNVYSDECQLFLNKTGEENPTNPLIIFLALQFFREVDGTVVPIGCSHPCVLCKMVASLRVG